VVVVTGATEGLGLETARRLGQLGADLLLPCRNLTKGHKVADDLRSSGVQSVTMTTLDLASLDSVRKGAEEINAKAPNGVDVLINNAGFWPAHYEKTVDGFEKTFQVNHLSVFLFTNLLVPRMRKGARVVVLSSGLNKFGSYDVENLQFEKETFNGDKAYRNSKVLNIMFANELNRQLAGQGVTVNSVHPGVILTKLHREDYAHRPVWRFLHQTAIALFGKSSPKQGAQTSIYAAVSPALEGQGGLYLSDCAPSAPNAIALDEVAAQQLWHVSAKLAGL